MGQSDDVEDSTYSRHQDLCQKLNMDATAAAEAWKSYETIRQNYTLEVVFKPFIIVTVPNCIVIFKLNNTTSHYFDDKLQMYYFPFYLRCMN